MSSVSLKRQTQLKKVDIPLASSKSESNRALIMSKLSKQEFVLDNLSSARDTQIMQNLLSSTDSILNVKDAGTVMRFMTAYLAVNGIGVTLTGTERMCQRPIGVLVEALKKIGARIEYCDKDGYPPLQINALNEQLTGQLKIPGNISSQYISALMMIAPILPNGLEITLEGEIYSLPYINMTSGLMEHFGIKYTFKNQTINIPNQAYAQAMYTIESDWSGASYWYGFVALAEEAEVKLLGLKEKSFQGDQAIVEIMESLGVKSHFRKDGVILSKSEQKQELSYDFRNCPDLAQTVIAVAAAKRIELTMTGLESLKIKETDRTGAMTKEVAKVGALLKEIKEGTWKLTFDNNHIPNEPILFETYDDHRMAMALAPLCMKYDIIVDNPTVVQKSYPEYWDHLELAGLIVERS